jgi:hypothetical protein
MEAFEKLTNGYVVDYTGLRIGSPAGDRFVIACEKCKKPGLAHGRKCLHVVRYRQTPSGKSAQDIVKACGGGAPRVEAPPVKQTGLPWCPKEWL